MAEAFSVSNTPIEEIVISDLPNMSISERREFPCVRCVYFAIDREDSTRILYIGSTIDLRQRWNGHANLRRLEEAGGLVAWFEQPFDQDLLGLERRARRHFKPLWNRGGAEFEGFKRWPESEGNELEDEGEEDEELEEVTLY